MEVFLRVGIGLALLIELSGCIAVILRTWAASKESRLAWYWGWAFRVYFAGAVCGVVYLNVRGPQPASLKVLAWAFAARALTATSVWICVAFAFKRF